MKKTLSMLLALCMVLSLVACGNSTGSSSSEKPSAEETADGQLPEVKFTFAVVEKDPSSTNDLNVDGRAAKMFVDLVAEKSEGRITIEPYYGGILGSDSAGVVLDGDADLGFFSVTSKYAPMAACFNLPRMMSDFDMAYDLMKTDGEIYKLYYEEVHNAGLTLLAGSAGTFRQFYNNEKEVHLPEDVKGMNIRVYADDTVQTFWGALCNQVTMPMNEVYTGLQMGTIDAMEFPATNFIGFSLPEVTKYCTVVNWQWMFNPFVYMTNELYDSTDPAVIKVLEECAQETMDWYYNEQKAQLDNALAEMEKQGMIVTRLTAEEESAWDEIALETYKAIGEKLGSDAPELIAKIKKITDDYKASR